MLLSRVASYVRDKLNCGFYLKLRRIEIYSQKDHVRETI